MAIPSGYGSEVLLAASADYTSAQNTNSALITATAHQIVTILSCTFCSTSATSVVSIKIGSKYILYNQSIPVNTTFVWNDKLVFQNDTFLIRTHDANQVLVYASYILQDWTTA